MLKARTIKVEPDLWEAAKEQADRDGVSLSHAIRRFLDEYARGHLRLETNLRKEKDE